MISKMFVKIDNDLSAPFVFYLYSLGLKLFEDMNLGQTISWTNGVYCVHCGILCAA